MKNKTKSNFRCTLLCSVLASVMSIAGCSHAQGVGTHDTHTNHSAEIFTGELSAQKLLREYPVFANNKAADPFVVDRAQLAVFAEKLDGKHLMIFMGTWCHDSQREVPRLLNILDALNTYHANVNIDIHIQALPIDKRSEPLAVKHDIYSVPTMIVFDRRGEGQRELTRMIERPVKNLLVDLSTF